LFTGRIYQETNTRSRGSVYSRTRIFSYKRIIRWSF